MTPLFQHVKPNHIVRLAAMECGSSCTMTALGMLGENPDYFLLDYWNLNYDAPTLTGNFDLQPETMSFMYGLELASIQSDLASMDNAIRSGQIVILRCNASKLDYFPQKFLIESYMGDHHYILVYGHNAVSNDYLIIDPIAQYVGELKVEAIVHAVESVDELFFYTLGNPASGKQRYLRPNNELRYAYAVKRNWERYASESSIIAIHSMKDNMADLPHWDAEVRDNWIYQNNIAISTIVKLRSMIWKSFFELNVLSPTLLEEGRQMIQTIVKQWTMFNMQLTRLKRQNDDNFVASMINQFDEIIEHERRFLHWLYQQYSGEEIVHDL